MRTLPLLKLTACPFGHKPVLSEMGDAEFGLISLHTVSGVARVGEDIESHIVFNGTGYGSYDPMDEPGAVDFATISLVDVTRIEDLLTNPEILKVLQQEEIGEPISGADQTLKVDMGDTVYFQQVAGCDNPNIVALLSLLDELQVSYFKRLTPSHRQ